MDHKGWFTVIQSGLILESFLLPEVCICACGYMCDACVWIHVRLCVCVCVCIVQLPECRLACFSLLCWYFANGQQSCAVYQGIVNRLAVFPASISFHFLLGALSREQGCSHFLLLVSALFASLLPKGTMALLKGPFELCVQ